MKSMVFGMLCLLLVAGCTQPEVRTTSLGVVTCRGQERKFEILYVLNHSRYHLTFTCDEKGYFGQYRLDDQLLKQARGSDPLKFIGLYHRLGQFIDAGATHPEGQRTGAGDASRAACRSPFTISVHKADEVRRLHGCRTPEDDGGLGKLIREAEFLLYSRKI